MQRSSRPALKGYKDFKRFSLARNFRPADFITICNGFCGASSILSSISLIASLDSPSILSNLTAEQLSIARWAFGLPFLGAFFDIMDGRVARWHGDSSMLGQELDSLADLVSFGVAPVTLAYLVGLRYSRDLIILGIFVCAGIARLARFNVTANMIPIDSKGKMTYFQGLPIPSSLFLVFIMWCWVEMDILNIVPGGEFRCFGGPIHTFSIVWFVWSICMLSKNLKVPKL